MINRNLDWSEDRPYVVSLPQALLRQGGGRQVDLARWPVMAMGPGQMERDADRRLQAIMEASGGDNLRALQLLLASFAAPASAAEEANEA